MLLGHFGSIAKRVLRQAMTTITVDQSSCTSCTLMSPHYYINEHPTFTNQFILQYAETLNADIPYTTITLVITFRLNSSVIELSPIKLSYGYFQSAKFNNLFCIRFTILYFYFLETSLLFLRSDFVMARCWKYV